MMIEERADQVKGSEDMLTEPNDVADAMLQLCENPEYGDGTILEVIKAKTRVIPPFSASPPQGDGSALPGYLESSRKTIEKLKTNGLKV